MFKIFATLDSLPQPATAIFVPILYNYKNHNGNRVGESYPKDNRQEAVLVVIVRRAGVHVDILVLDFVQNVAKSLIVLKHEPVIEQSGNRHDHQHLDCSLVNHGPHLRADPIDVIKQVLVSDPDGTQV